MMHKPNNIWSWIAFLLIMTVLFIGIIDKKGWTEKSKTIESDVVIYYNYLPAVFIYDDIHLNYYDNYPELKQYNWVVPLENENRLLKMSYGLSVLYSPFFFAAHLYAKNSHYEANGYTKPYHFALAFSAFFYSIITLLLLFRLLRRYFDDLTTAITLLAIFIGTNLFYYITHEPGMSHAFNLFLIVVFLSLVQSFYKKPRLITATITGITAGLISVIRPTNSIVVLLLFIFWDVRRFGDLRLRLNFWLNNYSSILALLGFAFLPWIPQLYYWKIITGQWLYFSYAPTGEGFFFDNPQIFNSLFSYKKGWLLYTPMMFLAIIGIPLMKKNLKPFFWPVVLILPIMVYVLSSWWNWWFGGGFGLRAYIDIYGLMAFPLAMLVGLSLKNKILRFVLPPLILVLIAFNLFQTTQYKNGAIHYWWMNKEMYWETFLKKHPTTEYYNMVKIPDIKRAKRGVYVALFPEEIKELNEIRKIKKEILIVRNSYPKLFHKHFKSHTEREGETEISEDVIAEYQQFKKQRIARINDSLRSDSIIYDRTIIIAKDRGITADSMFRANARYIYEQKFLKP